jgi:hypothetical protein
VELSEIDVDAVEVYYRKQSIGCNPSINHQDFAQGVLTMTLHYYFHEFHTGHQSIIHHFGTNRVAAFASHRQLEKQGKKLSAVQIKKLGNTKTKAA